MANDISAAAAAATLRPGLRHPVSEILRLCVVCSALLAAATARAEYPEKPVLRLVTYNIHHAQGRDGIVDLDRIAAIVRALAPDIVCLQEVDRNLPRTNHQDFPALFAEKLGMPVTFASNYNFQGGEYGNATFSRLPLLSWKNEPLPGPEGVEPRGRLETVYDWNGKPLLVWNTHLGLKAEERQQQAAHILSNGFPANVILGGDMNESTRGLGLQQVMKLLGKTHEQHLCDDPTFPAGSPRVRIDHIFTGADYEVKSCQVVQNSQTALASDHLPVLAEIRD